MTCRLWPRRKPQPDVPPPVDPGPSIDAIAAAGKARLTAEQVVARTEAIAALARMQRAENHFAPRIRAAFEEGRR